MNCMHKFKVIEMNKHVIILIVLFCITFRMSGQKAPIKFGDVSLEDLQMVTYPADTSAPAVILCDYGYFNTTNAQFTRIQRIKILRKEGYYWANSGYPCSANTQIRGVTTNLENGKIVTNKLKNESIFKDRITENRYVMRVAMPNVKVGSVIDIQFSFIGIMAQWKFQDLIPVRYSELVLPNTTDVRFKYNFFGYEPLFFSSPTRWIAKDMPSFKVEPYMSSIENYETKLEFDILEIGVHSISSSWEVISNLLMMENNFGVAIKTSGYLNELAKSIKNSKGTPEEMLKTAYDTIKKTVKWNEKESIVASSPSLNFPYRMKIGNSADINLILLQLLKKLDFDAVPIAMSTRENGLLSTFSPSIEKLNYVIVQVKVGGKTFLLDASESQLPYNLIPLRCLNGSGRIVDEINSTLVNLVTSYKEKDFTTYHLKLKEDESLEGDIMVRRLDYSAFDFRKKYRTFNSPDEYLEDFKKDKIGLQINESKIENIDSIYLPVVEDYSVKMTDQVNEIGNEVYINPLFYNQLKENPFKTDKRNYPVDYGYNIEKSTTIILEIPENYELSALPAPVTIKLPANAGSLTYMSGQSGNIINIKSVFTINKSLFLPSEYKVLKEFYNQVIKKQSEPIVLKRK